MEPAGRDRGWRQRACRSPGDDVPDARRVVARTPVDDARCRLLRARGGGEAPPSRTGIPLAVWTVSILPTYVAFHVREATGEWIVPCWLVAVAYGSVAAAAVWVAARRWRTAR